jgi:hypothetical protein
MFEAARGHARSDDAIDEPTVVVLSQGNQELNSLSRIPARVDTVELVRIGKSTLPGRRRREFMTRKLISGISGW